MRRRNLTWSWFMTAALALSPVDPADADAVADPANAAPPAARLDWAPPAPNPTQSDWIQLDTHEWLKGKIERIQDDSVFFDSDKAR